MQDSYTIATDKSEKTKPSAKKYSENEALKRAQKKYYEQNKEVRLEYARKFNANWRRTEDYEIVKQKQRERAKRHYEKKRLMKKQQELNKSIMESNDKQVEELDKILMDMLNLKMVEPPLQAQEPIS